MTKPKTSYRERWLGDGDQEILYYKAPTRLAAMELVLELREQGFDARYEPYHDDDGFTDHNVETNYARRRWYENR